MFAKIYSGSTLADIGELINVFYGCQRGADRKHKRNRNYHFLYMYCTKKEKNPCFCSELLQCIWYNLFQFKRNFSRGFLRFTESYCSIISTQNNCLCTLRNFLWFIKKCNKKWTVSMKEVTTQKNSLFSVYINHRIKDDRMENSIKGIQIWHCVFAASIILCSTPTQGN